MLAAHRALTALNEALAAGRTREAVLGQIAEAAATLVPEATVNLWLVGESGRDLWLAAGREDKRGEAIAPPRTVLSLGEGLVGVVARSREAVVVPSLDRDPRRVNRAWMREQGFVSFAGLPFARPDRILGVLSVFTRQRHRFTRQELELLRAFASQAAVALENAALFDAATSRLRRLETLREIEREIVQQRDPEALLGLIARRATELLDADSATVYLFDEDARVLRPRAAFNVGEWIRDVTIPLAEGVVGAAARRREGMIVNDYQRSPYAIAPFRRLNHAIVAQPLLHAGALQGVIVVNRQAPDRPFGPADLNQLADLAVQATIAMENARLFAQTRRRQDTAETLAAISHTLTGSLDLPTVLSRVADGIRRLLGCDGGAIGMVEADGSVRLTVVVGLGAEVFRGLVVRPGQGIGGQALARSEPFWTADYLSDPRVSSDFHAGVRAAGIVAELAVPVRLQERVVGVLWASYGRSVQIRPDDLALAADLAQVVAIAVANARLYAEARQREAEARGLFDVGRLIGATLEPARVLDLIVEKARELMRVRACGVFRLDESNHLRYARGAGLSPAFVRGVALPIGEGTSGRSVTERAPVWTADILRDPKIPLSPAVRTLVEREGYRAVLSVPILIKEAPSGCLATYWWERHVPTPGEMEMLSSLAALAGVALENARLYGETREYVARLERLNQLNRTVSASLRLDDVLATVAGAAGALFDAPLVMLWVADEERRVLTRRAGHGDPEFLARLPMRLAYGEAGSGWVALHRTPLLGVAVAEDPRIVGREWPVALGFTSFSGMPVVLGDRLLGVLALGGHRDAPLVTADLTLLETLLGQAAIAIENARLYEEAQRREAEAVALAEASQRFGASLRREAVLESLAGAAVHVLGEMWVVFLVDPETRELKVVARTRSAGAEGPAEGASLGEAPMRIDERLVGQVAATGRPLLFPDVADLPADHPSRPDLERWGVRSVLLVPVTAGSVVRAVLAGSVYDDGRRFTERDVPLAEAVADRAAIALENARLYEELTQAYEELKTAQERLVQHEKLRALGEMASGVAHDFNNLLAAILGRIQLVLSRIEDPTLRRWLEVVERAALDGAQTVRRIQEFTRIRRDQPTETVDLNSVVRDAVEMTRTRWRDEPRSRGLDVRVTTDFQPVPSVDGHAGELRQVFTNLILNAVEAMPHGGTIAIATQPADDAVEISVADTGTGMADEVRRRVFEPFFSTKGPQGTGLGLAMVYGIVSRHGGSITVESREGTGATFAIWLPAGRREVAPEPEPPTLPVEGGLRVLVIDDDESVRETLADMLREASHEVVVASDGMEGLERFRVTPFDLVLTDLGMPGMSGAQIARTIKALRSEVPVVLVTGWGIELPSEELRESGIDRVMTKPIKVDDVRATLASLRARTSRRR